MKYFFSFLFSIMVLALSAQINVENVQYKKKNFESLQTSIDAEKDIVEDYLDDFWDDRYEVDIDKYDNNKLSTAYLAEQVAVPIISDKNFDLYAKVDGTGTKSTVSMAIAFTDNDIVTREAHRKSFDAAEAVMREFRTYFYTRYFDEKLEVARKDLADIRDDKVDASEDAEKASKKIEKYEDKIAKLQRKIDKEREEVGDELETAEEKAKRAKKLEDQVRELERMKAKYLG